MLNVEYISKAIQACPDEELKAKAMEECKAIEAQKEVCQEHRKMMHDLAQPVQLVMNILELPVYKISDQLKLLAMVKDKLLVSLNMLKAEMKTHSIDK